MIHSIHSTKERASLTVFPKLFVFLSTMLMVLVFGTDMFGQAPPVVYTSSGTWTCPAGVTSITVECWGAGGGGGGRSSNGASGGGGGGAYASSTLTVIPNNSYAIAVGSGGAGSVNGNTTAKNGGDSSFGSTLVVAQGGRGVANNTNNGSVGGAAASSTGQTKRNGGNGDNNTGGNGGYGGGAAGRTSAGNGINNGGLYGGNGGATQSGNANGNPGAIYGAGGGGAKRTGGTKTGGAGANGLVVITINDALWQNPIIGTGINSSSPYTEGDLFAPNIATPTGITKGSAPGAATANNIYEASGWTSGSLNTNAYFEFTLTPANGYMLNLASFNYTGNARATGLGGSAPSSFAVRSSLNGYASNIGSPTASGNIDLSSISYQYISTPVTFHVYAWNGTPGLFGDSFYGISSFAFRGTSTPIVPATLTSFLPTNGCPGSGESVVITGTNFYGVSAVKFNGVSASYTVNSTTQITATLPNGASTGAISVTTIGGTVNSGNDFTVYGTGNEVVFSANFNDNSLTGWQQTPANSWDINSNSLHTSTSIGPTWGNNTVRSINKSTPDVQDLTGRKTVWRFNSRIKTDGVFGFQYGSDVYVMLATDNSNMNNGYAVRFNYNYQWFFGDYYTYTITLCKVTNGVSTDITTPYSFNFYDTNIGIEVTRNESGSWEIKTDNNGGFDALVSRGTGTDTQYSTPAYFGVKATLSSTAQIQATASLWFDDVEVNQTYCEEIYYSQTDGNFNGTVWSRERVGTPVAVTSNDAISFVVQDTDAITTSANQTAKHVTVETGGELAFSGTNTLTLHGNLANQGTITSGTGTISFNGSAAQSYTSNSEQTLNNVIANNASTVTFPSNIVTNIKPNGVVTIQSGTFNTGDNLFLRSTAAGTASIGTISAGASLSGQLTLERFLPNLQGPALVGNGSYIAVGTPIVGATVQQWNETVFTTGFPGSDFPPPGYNFNNIQWYNEAATGNINNGYTGVTGLGETLHSDKGYFFYTYADLPNPQNMLRAKGNIQQGTFNDTLSYTNSGTPAADGWNLLVNRYPSEIDFKSIAEAGVGGITSYHLFDAETNNYKVYHTNAASTAPRYIASGQAFFVQANALNSYLRYQESFKSNQGTAFERSLDETSFAAIKFYKAANNADECVLNFNNNATAAFENEYDAVKLHSSEPTAAECALVSADDKLMTIDSRPIGQEESVSIPVYVEMPVSGTYRLRIEQIHNLPFGSCLFVEDLVTGNTIPVQEGQELVITHTGNYSGNRFLIHASPSIAVTETNAACFGTNTGAIELTTPQGDWTISLADTLGNTYAANGWLYENLPAGEYIASATSALSNCPVSTKNITIAEPAEMVLTHLSSDIDHCNASANAAIEWKVSNATSYDYSVTNEAGETISTGNAGSASVVIGGLHAGIYTVSVETYCNTQSFEVNLYDTNVVSAEILSGNIAMALLEGTTQTLTIAQSNENATNVTWSLSNGYISQGETFSYEFAELGDYTLTLFAHNNHCAAQDSINIFIDRAVSVDEEAKQTPVSFIQTKESLELYLNIASSDNTTVTVYDINGRIVWNMNTTTHKGKNISIGTGSFAAGIYVIKTTVGKEEVFNKKFINP